MQRRAAKVLPCSPATTMRPSGWAPSPKPSSPPPSAEPTPGPPRRTSHPASRRADDGPARSATDRRSERNPPRPDDRPAGPPPRRSRRSRRSRSSRCWTGRKRPDPARGRSGRPPPSARGDQEQPDHHAPTSATTNSHHTPQSAVSNAAADPAGRGRRRSAPQQFGSTNRRPCYRRPPVRAAPLALGDLGQRRRRIRPHVDPPRSPTGQSGGGPAGRPSPRRGRRGRRRRRRSSAAVGGSPRRGLRPLRVSSTTPRCTTPSGDVVGRMARCSPPERSRRSQIKRRGKTVDSYVGSAHRS
jgi:hypothetical protein